jgi:hypothetical protein
MGPGGTGIRGVPVGGASFNEFGVIYPTTTLEGGYAWLRDYHTLQN